MGIQLVIVFLDLFKGSLWQNSGRLVLGLGCKTKNGSKRQKFIIRVEDETLLRIISIIYMI